MIFTRLRVSARSRCGNRQALKDCLIKHQNTLELLTWAESVIQLKFVYGKTQKVDSIELDKLFTDLQGVLQTHPLVPAANIDALVSEWINDLLFLAGKITEEELQEAMQTFEKVEASAEQAAPAEGAAEKGEEAEEDDDDE
jgi:hypothetical protein